MVGGRVAGVFPGDHETKLLVRNEYGDEVVVRTHPRPSDPVGFGDTVWWQSGKIYWSPSRDPRPEVEMEKLGPSVSAEDADIPV